MLRAFRDAVYIPELRRKLLLTLALLAVYRLGAAIPTPGVNADALQRAATSGSAAGVFNLLGLVSGGNIERFSIFALGVLPYITASIVMQLMTTAIPALEKLQKEGEEGRRKINQYTRYSSIALAAIQSLFFASTILGDASVLKAGWGTEENVLIFRLTVVITQVCGSAFTMWLGERITEYGLGNGISLLIFAGIVSRFPTDVQQTGALLNTGEVTFLSVLLFAALIILVVGAIVVVQQAERRIPVQYARKVVGRRVYGGQATYIPLKVNTAGVIPIIFASALLSLPGIIALAFRGQAWANTLQNLVSVRTGYGLAFEVLLIVAFTYFYTGITFDPKRVSENLREYGGFVPGVRPGQPTTEYLAKISGRITLWGAVFLGLLAITPQIFQNLTHITTFPLGGTTLLIVVGVALDTLKQIEAQLTMRNYEGFIRKGRIRGRTNNF